MNKIRISAALVAVLIASVLAGCSIFEEEIYSGGDLYTCVINTRTGKVTKEIPSGDEQGYTLGEDELAYQVPTSNRFYNITANRANADDGAPAFLTGQSDGYRAIQAQVTTRFVFKQTEICNFVLKHVKRNDGNADGDFQFGARLEPGDPNTAGERANTEWAVWLNENFAPGLQKVGMPIWQQYGWERLEFNYPTNANADGSIPADTEAGTLTWKQIEADLGKAFTEELNAKLGGEFFCGVGYSPEKPDECPQLDIDVLDISLEDQAPVTERVKLDLQRDEQENASQAAGIAERTLEEKRKSQAADEELAAIEVAEAERNAAVAAAKERATLEEKLAAHIANTPELLTCLALIDRVGTCPQLESAKQQPGGDITFNQGG